MKQARKVAQRVKISATRTDDLTLTPQDAPGRRK